MKKIKLSEVVSKLEERGLHKSAENVRKILGVGEVKDKTAWLYTIEYVDKQLAFFESFLQKNSKFFSGREMGKLSSIVRESSKLPEMAKTPSQSKKLKELNILLTKTERGWVDFLLGFKRRLEDAKELRRFLKRSKSAIQKLPT